MNCKICASPVQKILDLSRFNQVTSLGSLISGNGNASIYGCNTCSHCQTESDIDLQEYYAHNYKTLMNAPDEDDVYEINNGNIIYRTEHIAATFVDKISEFRRSNVIAHFI